MNNVWREEKLVECETLRKDALTQLAKATRTGRLIAFTGSHATAEFDYPDWKELLTIGASELPSLDPGRQSSLYKELDWARCHGSDAALIAHAFLQDSPDTGREAVNAKLKREFRIEPKALADPSVIGKIIGMLGIRRIITLNYDLETEFALLPSSTSRDTDKSGTWEYFSTNWKQPDSHDNALRLRSPDPSQRRQIWTHDSTLQISDIFSRERTDRLFEFALGASSVGGHVMHLHGRVDQPQGLIISYQDYEKLYRQSSLTKLPFEHAMRSLYAGNPILFVGLGLSEDEMLHHLQQFVSDGRPHNLAPQFVLWSPRGADWDAVNPDNRKPQDMLDGKFNRKNGSVSAEDEFRRLRWWRRYGIYTIYDTELEGFDQDADLGPEGSARDQLLSRSIGYLAQSLGKAVQHHRWERSHFRTMQGFLSPKGSEHIPRNGAIIWPVVDQKDLYYPNWKLGQTIEVPLKKSEDPLKKSEDSLEKPGGAQYLESLIDHGPPIKAWLDVPGAGHGYFSRLIRKLVTDKQNSSEPGGGLPPTILAQINAGFAWEIDTTFELISGLYDGRLSFEEGIGRKKSMDRFLKKLFDDLGKKEKIPSRKIVILLNGADRFFDPDGYPLSSDLDNLLRMIPNLQRELRLEGYRGLFPISLFLFGTGRVARYLKKALGEKEATVKFLGTLQPPFDGENERREEEQWVDSSLMGYLQAEYTKYKSTNPKSLDLLPITFRPTRDEKTQLTHSEPEEFSSVYLRATERLLIAAIKRNDSAWQIPGHDLFQLNRNRTRGPRHQRGAFFDAFCNIDALAKALTDDGIKGPNLAKLALAIMRTMAFVGQPIEVTTMACCPKVHEYRSYAGLKDQSDFSKFVANLCSLNLIAEIEGYPGNPEPIEKADITGKRYGLHRALLHEIRDRNTVPLSDARTYTSFNIPLFMAQPIDDSEPSQHAYAGLEGLIKALIESDQIDTVNKVDADSNVYGMRLRAAMASLRSYFTTSAMLMNEPEPAPSEKLNPRLTEHSKLLEQLIDGFWRNSEHHSQGVASAEVANIEKVEIEKKERPKSVFPDDLVWLHDQRGVALLAQGDLYEAQEALRQARKINAEFVEPDDRLGVGPDGYHGQNWRRIAINEVHVDIERGRIGDAQEKLRGLEQSIEDLCQSVYWRLNLQHLEPGKTIAGNAFQTIADRYGIESSQTPRQVDPVFPADAILLTALVRKYQAWCAYIGGRLRTADRLIDQAVWILRNLGEHRAYAIALRLRAAIHRALGEIPKSRECLRLCLASADAGRQMDISHHAWIEQAELDLEHPETTSADDHYGSTAKTLKQLNTSLRYATLTEMYRVRLEARMALAKLRKATGDFDGALEHASDALALAMRFGFALRKITLRTLVGEILILRGDPVSGHSLLAQALDEGDRIGYQRAVEQVHALQLRYAI